MEKLHSKRDTIFNRYSKSHMERGSYNIAASGQFLPGLHKDTIQNQVDNILNKSDSFDMYYEQ
jgi:hypothetical protein